MRSIAALFLAMLAGCGVTPAVQYARWIPAQRPIELRIDTGINGACLEAVDAALDFWRDHGVGYLAETSGEATDAREIGVITVESGELGPGEAGNTDRARVGDMMLYARVKLASCDPLTAAHELGHALGLEHNPRAGTVMYFAVGSAGWELDSEEREWVR